MKTYFIRHTDKLDIDDDTRGRLWTKCKIAIHYPEDRHGKIRSKDNNSLKPGDYKHKGRSCVRILGDLAENGGYVCAQFHNKEQLMLGIVRRNSKIKRF